MTNIIKLYFITIFCILLFAVEITAQDQKVLKKDTVSQVAYGKQPYWKISSSISSVKGEILEKSFTQNPMNALYGVLPGLTVMQGSGEPGMDTPGIFLRGINSYTGNQNQKVLIILDGFESSIDQLVVQEIEEITLLKDAAALAIYGSKGANGALLVKTKRGINSPLQISFSTQLGWQNPIRIPKFLDSYNFANLYNEACTNDGKSLQYDINQLNAYKQGNVDKFIYPDVNWSNELFKNSSIFQNYNLTLRGGNQVVSYFTLVNISNNEGLYNGIEKKRETNSNINVLRYNIRSNIDLKVTNDMTVALTMGASIQDRNSPMYIDASGIPNYDASGLLGNIYSTPPNAFPVYNPNGTVGGNATWTNPLANLLETGFSNANSRNLQTTLAITQNFDFLTKGLSATAAISFNSYFVGYTNKTKEYARYSLSKNSLGDYEYTQYGQNTSLAIDETQYSQWRNLTYRGIIDYNREFGINSVSATLVFNSQKNVTSGFMPFKNNQMGGRFNYAFDRRYIAEFSFGYNGTENFAPGKRYGFFPAAALGWILSNEQFLAKNKLINYLKIRGSFGLTGNDIIGGDRFMYDKYYGYGNMYYLGDNNTGNINIEELRMNNPFLTWEKQRQINFGFEGTLLKQLSFTVDIFKNNRYDILSFPYSTIPDFAGMTLPYLNVGKVENKGFELSLRYDGKSSGSLQYFIETKFWFAQNKIKEMSEELHQYPYQYQTGNPVNQPFGLVSLGLFKDESDIANSPKQLFGPVQPGDIKYKDLNDDKIIDNQDITAIGKTVQPTLTGSIRLGATFKGFDIELLVQGVANRSVSLTGNYYWAFQNNTSAPSIALTRWTNETAKTATYPRLSTEYNENNYESSDFWQRNGDFIKIRNLELGYTIPDEISKRIKLKNARVFLNGTNLFSLDHLVDFDPETIAGYPAQRTFSLGVKVLL